MLCLLLWSALLSGAPSDAHVTFTMRAVPLEKAVAEIARQSGANLTVDPPIAKELVILRLKDAPLADVKKRLAQTVDAEWTTQGPKEVLTRTPEIVKRRKQEAFAERVARWQKTIDALGFDEEWERRYSDTIKGFAVSTQQAETQAERNASSRRQVAFRSQTPQGRLLARALRLIGAERLAEVGVDQRVVFSTLPTRMQVPIVDPNNRLYDAYLVEGRSWQQAMRQWVDDDQHRIGYYSPFLGEEPPPGGFVHVVISATYGDSFAEPRLYAPDGINAPPMLFARSMLSGEEPKPIAGFDTPIVDSEETVATKRLLRPKLGDPPGSVPRLGLEILLHPESHELMAGGPSDVAIEAAEYKDLNMVATLPDAAHVYTLKDLVGRPVTLGTALTRFQELAEVNVDEKAGWLTIRRRPGELADSYVIPRKAIATLVKTARRSGAVTLDALAAYASSGVCLDAMSYGLTLANRAVGGTRDYIHPASWKALRLYASLSTQQRAAAANGGATIPIAAMTNAQRVTVAEIVYGEDQSFSRNGPTEPILGQGFPIASSIQSEPTSVLPNGLPPDGAVTFKVGSVPRLYGIGDGPYASPQEIDPRSVALNAFFRERGKGTSDTERYAPKRFAMGSVDNLTVILDLPPAGFLAVGASLNRISLDAKWTGMEGLPKAIRDSIAEELDELRKNNPDFTPPTGDRTPARP